MSLVSIGNSALSSLFMSNFIAESVTFMASLSASHEFNKQSGIKINTNKYFLIINTRFGFVFEEQLFFSTRYFGEDIDSLN
jgi:hypothetical protein